MMKIYCSILLLFISFSCKQAPQKEIPNRTLVKNVHIVEVEQGTILENRHILVGAETDPGDYGCPALRGIQHSH